MSFAAISTATMALFLLGGLALAYLNVMNQTRDVEGRFTIRVHLDDEVPRARAREIGTEIRSLSGVRLAEFISREQGLAVFRRENPTLNLEDMGIDDNPFPDSYRVTLQRLEDTARVADAIKRIEGVEQPGGVIYLDEEQRFVTQALTLFRWIGIGLGSLMLATTGVLIYNAIRLTVLARQREIRIMHLVGATRATITIPMLIEGLVQGVLGGVIATGLLWGAHTGIDRMLSSLSALGRLGGFPIWEVAGILTTLGGLYGLICSAFSMRESLRRL